MIRNIDMNTISDGKKYTSSDLARLGCNDCSGCSSCCQGMSDTIILDPYDIYTLTSGLGYSFDQLLGNYINLKIIDGVILPILKMDSQTDCCHFLDEKGRCRIHTFRPGICRLFPLGRLYEDGSFRYFLQKDECKKKNRTKVKISSWIGIPQIAKYESFLTDWHYAMKNLGQELAENTDESQIRKIQYMLLQLFYRKNYDPNRDFYEQYEERMKMIQ